MSVYTDRRNNQNNIIVEALNKYRASFASEENDMRAQLKKENSHATPPTTLQISHVSSI